MSGRVPEAADGEFTVIGALRGALKPGECCPECERNVTGEEAEMRAGSRSRVAFDAEIKFEIAGRRGDVIRREIQSAYLFRILKKLATDTSEHRGEGTLVRDFTIAGKPQFPPGALPRPASEFSDSPLGCGVKFDDCQAGQSIGLEIEFLVDCEFHAVFFGKAVKNGGEQ